MEKQLKAVLENQEKQAKKLQKMAKKANTFYETSMNQTAELPGNVPNNVNSLPNFLCELLMVCLGKRENSIFAIGKRHGGDAHSVGWDVRCSFKLVPSVPC